MLSGRARDLAKRGPRRSFSNKRERRAADGAPADTSKAVARCIASGVIALRIISAVQRGERCARRFMSGLAGARNRERR
jgi:hypothetical protein